MVLVVDRGLLSLDNLDAAQALRTATSGAVEYILVVPARRYVDFGELVANTLVGLLPRGLLEANTLSSV